MPDNDGEASPMIISQSTTHIVVAFEISRATLARHRRFLEMLLAAEIEPPHVTGG
jgi:hypothetical protein